MSTSNAVTGTGGVGVVAGQVGVPRCRVPAMPKGYPLTFSLFLKYKWSQEDTSTPEREYLQRPVSVLLVCLRITLLLRLFLAWHDWLLDLNQIMNHHQMPVMISDQCEDLRVIFLLGQPILQEQRDH